MLALHSPLAMPKDSTPEIDSGTKSVRKRKRLTKSSIQQYIPIAEIRNDTVLLKKGGLRAVLEVEAMNFNLKSETEQMGIISGYQSFMNSLTFPIQITMRSSKMNIDPYIMQLRGLADAQQNPLLKKQTQSYADFVEKIVDVADIMQKRFYVVIPLDDTAPKRSPFSLFFSWMGMGDNSGKALQRHKSFQGKHNKLRERVNLIQTGLHNVGLMTKRLKTHELIELYYQIYNPGTSQEQKITNVKDLNVEKMVL